MGVHTSIFPRAKAGKQRRCVRAVARPPAGVTDREMSGGRSGGPRSASRHRRGAGGDLARLCRHGAGRVLCRSRGAGVHPAAPERGPCTTILRRPVDLGSSSMWIVLVWLFRSSACCSICFWRQSHPPSERDNPVLGGRPEKALACRRASGEDRMRLGRVRDHHRRSHVGSISALVTYSLGIGYFRVTFPSGAGVLWSVSLLPRCFLCLRRPSRAGAFAHGSEPRHLRAWDHPLPLRGRGPDGPRAGDAAGGDARAPAGPLVSVAGPGLWCHRLDFVDPGASTRSPW